jgi:hypothetical protein
MRNPTPKLSAGWQDAIVAAVVVGGMLLLAVIAGAR